MEKEVKSLDGLIEYVNLYIFRKLEDGDFIVKDFTHYGNRVVYTIEVEGHIFQASVDVKGYAVLSKFGSLIDKEFSFGLHRLPKNYNVSNEKLIKSFRKKMNEDRISEIDKQINNLENEVQQLKRERYKLL